MAISSMDIPTIKIVVATRVDEKSFPCQPRLLEAQLSLPMESSRVLGGEVLHYSAARGVWLHERGGVASSDIALGEHFCKVRLLYLSTFFIWCLRICFTSVLIKVVYPEYHHLPPPTNVPIKGDLTWAKATSLVFIFWSLPWTDGPNTQFKWKLR